jgi:hypothetical protein
MYAGDAKQEKWYKTYDLGREKKYFVPQEFLNDQK